MVEIKKEDIAEALNVIKRIISCQRNLKNCSAECSSCECNYSIEEYDKAFDVAIAILEANK